MKALVTKASEVCFSEGKEMEKQGKNKSKKVTKTHFAQALTAIRPSVQGTINVLRKQNFWPLFYHFDIFLLQFISINIQGPSSQIVIK